MPEYYVRAVKIIDADNPVLAVEEYIDYLRHVDLDDLVYRAEVVSGKDMFFVHAGNVISLEELFDLAAEDAEAEAVQGG